MKKLICVLLVLTMALGVMCACGGQGEEKAEDKYAGQFRAGYCRLDINPSQSVPLAGFGNTKFRYSDTFLDDVCVTSVAVSDEDNNTVIVITVDIVKVNDAMVQTIREEINKRTGVPKDHISMSATHSHSAVSYADTFDLYLTDVYYPYMTQRVIDSAVKALSDRKPATMFSGDIEAEGLNFVRHYYYENENGEKVYFGDQFGTAKLDSTTRHATEADPTMHILQFKREGGKDIVLVNWRGHPHFTDGSTTYNLSADYIGAFRSDMELTLDCNFAYFQGAAGNINTTSKISSENKTKELHAYSALLTGYATECLKNNMEELKGTKIQTRQYMFPVQANQDDLDKYTVAVEVATIWRDTGNREAAMAVAEPAGIRSPYHANAICDRYKNRDPNDHELNVYTIGDELAICTVPNEMFDTNSVWLEEHSPYAHTLFFGYANQNRIYIPSELGFEYTCYESDITRAKRGTAEEFMTKLVEMMADTKK